jgi:hypothetical protein
MFMNKEARERLEANGWELMGHSPSTDWRSFNSHLEALRGDTRFEFIWRNPLPSVASAGAPSVLHYSVWRRKRE